VRRRRSSSSSSRSASLLGGGGVLFSLAPRLLDLLPAEEGNAGRGVGEAQFVPVGAEDDAKGLAQE